MLAVLLFIMETTFVTSFSFPACQTASGKGCTLKGKNLLLGSKFFAFNVHPLVRREAKKLIELPPLKYVHSSYGLLERK